MNKSEKKMIRNCYKELQNIVLEAVENERELSKEDLLRDMFSDIERVMTILKFLSGESVLSIKG